MHQNQILKHQELMCFGTRDYFQLANFMKHLRRQRSCNKAISKGRSFAMCHVSRTHRVDSDRLHDRINLGPIQMKKRQYNTAIGRHSRKRIIHHDSHHIHSSTLSVSSAAVNLFHCSGLIAIPIRDKNADMDCHAAFLLEQGAGGDSQRENLCRQDCERVH